ncbi:MAG: DNA-binding transcriptional regulator EnvR [Deltaproteobacteria bacterium ADurb.Bin510]|nr:MAG: DNA-binding transcriptional regulator EnvR [Deltaproteobacteria bacterium ADurb.Bin510]
MNQDSPAHRIDLRVRRTYKLLINALTELLADKPYDKISVTDICEKAMVNRATFYKHFEDKNHLLIFGIKDIQEKLSSASLTPDHQKDPKQYYLKEFENSLHYLDKNEGLHALILASSESNPIMAAIYRTAIDDITSKLEYNEKQGFRHSVPIELIANFYAGALISTELWWLRNRDKTSIEAMIDYVDKLMNQANFVIKDD